jgi:dTDP-4-dehydrorhamnose reductase
LKKSERKTILILGATGLVGSNLFKHLKEKKYSVTGTYFKNKKKNYTYFDISKDSINLIKNIKKIKYIVIASAINVNLDDTKKNYKNSYFINVKKTKVVIDQCFKNDITPIYISSDAVFDGKKGNYKESDKKNPIHSYGRIKNEVEKYIIKKKKNYLIVRTSRIFGVIKNDNTFLTSLKEKIQTQEKVLCSNDQKFSPIFVNDLSNYIEKLIRNNYFGIFHLVSIKSITHYKIAKLIKKFFKIKKNKVISCKINSLKVIEKRPLLTNLLMYKFESLFNVKYNNLEYYLKKIRHNEKKNYRHK